MFCRLPKNWPEANHIRRRMAVFCVLFLTVFGFFHTAAHASTPLPTAAATMAAISVNDTNLDDTQAQLDVETTHCLGCTFAALPHMPGVTVPVIATEAIRERPLYQAVQQRRHADPPPPRVLI